MIANTLNPQYLRLRVRDTTELLHSSTASHVMRIRAAQTSAGAEFWTWKQFHSSALTDFPDPQAEPVPGASNPRRTKSIQSANATFSPRRCLWTDVLEDNARYWLGDALKPSNFAVCCLFHQLKHQKCHRIRFHRSERPSSYHQFDLHLWNNA